MAYHVIEGNVVGKKEKIGIVCARFNEFIVSKLLGGAIDGLVRHGISEENIDVAWVPGAFEIPVVAKKLAAMDLTASIMCMEQKMPMLVFALDEKDSIINAVHGKFVGTKVTV